MKPIEKFIFSQRPFILMIGFTSIALFIALYVFNPEFINDGSFYKYYGIGLIAITALYMIVFSIYRYLQNDKSNNNSIENDLKELKQLIRSYSSKGGHEFEQTMLEELKFVKKKLDESRELNLYLNENEKAKLFELFEAKLEKNLSKEFLESVQQKFGIEIIATERYTNLLVDLDFFKGRLRDEIKFLSKRANINLAIGVGATIGAIIGLYFLVVYEHPTFTDTIKLLSHYLPRLSFIIFIEIFAFFFLKMYKLNLENIRYYHNEMTNIEMKLVSLKTSLMSTNVDFKTIDEVIKELAKTERNFIVKKGDTTLELERMKNEISSSKNLFELTKKIVDKHLGAK